MNLELSEKLIVLLINLCFFKSVFIKNLKTCLLIFIYKNKKVFIFMGNSGFYLENQENCVFADNIKVGQMTTPLKENQLILGTTSTPKAAKISVSNGLSLQITDTADTPSIKDINLSLKKDDISDLIGDDMKDKITEEILNDIKDQLIKDILDQLNKDPAQSISKAFSCIEITEKYQCNGLFTEENVNTLLAGTEIQRFSFKPKSSFSQIIVTANILASRLEGNIVLALVKEGDTSPCAISYGYSPSLPNICQLRAVIENSSGTEMNFSLRVGGLDSGVVWVNAFPNGDSILNTESKSIITLLEVEKEKN